MRFAQFGLGSMGKRRVRCLKALGFNDIVAYDKREDRREDAVQKYGIKIVSKLEDIQMSEVDAFIISTPPDYHLPYLKLAVEHKKPAFIEASVVLDGLDEINKLSEKKSVVLAPSCTLKFHPVIKEISEIIKSKKYGKITNFSYHSGQYLPDWHPWEKVSDFYVSNKITGGCREIVPFELTWMVDVLGYPKKIVGSFGKTMDVGADIDDTYAMVLDYGNYFGTLIVDVVSRYAVRSLKINLENALIQWNWDDAHFSLYDAIGQRWIVYKQKEAQAAAGYNKNIIEDMYIDEVRSFINAANKKEEFPNTLEEDIKVLKLLYGVEGGKF